MPAYAGSHAALVPPEKHVILEPEQQPQNRQAERHARHPHEAFANDFLLATTLLVPFVIIVHGAKG